MTNVSHRTLRMLAALVWLSGSVVLYIKAGSLLYQAFLMKGELLIIGMISAGGLLIGLIKGKLIFDRSCRKNLSRINSLEIPKIWQFFRPLFFLFLILMILAGASLSRLAHNSFPLLISVALLDMTIATALLWSSRHFFTTSPLA